MDADDFVAEPSQYLIAFPVVGSLLRSVMRASVDFDDQALFTASKINEEVVNRKSAHEFESTEATIAQAVPELVFSRSALRS